MKHRFHCDAEIPPETTIAMEIHHFDGIYQER